jgi:hypothetical protein
MEDLETELAICDFILYKEHYSPVFRNVIRTSIALHRMYGSGVHECDL